MRKIRMGMIGGGIGSFIGEVHRMASRLDGHIDLVCGAFSSTAQRSKESGRDLYLPENRTYSNYEEMIKTESQLPENIRMDFVSIVTPNHLHFAPAKMALEHGFHVVCDKPMCFSFEEATELEKLVSGSDLIFALTHNYTAYPMVKQAKHLVNEGALGNIRKIVVEYPQGWLSTALEKEDQKQASWRTDPEKSGVAGAIGDIGTHAANLAEYIAGLKMVKVAADINTVVEGRRLDDDSNILLKYNNGATGTLIASQISAGEENNLRIKIYGEKGGLEWAQMEPNSLIVRWLDKPSQIFRTGVGDLCLAAQKHTRLPAGHPEGYLEAFANIYRNVAKCIQAKLEEEKVEAVYNDFPDVHDGVRGMLFIEKVIQAGNSSEKWLEI
jgi:predicted dehydrogenase